MPIHDWTRVPSGIFHDFHQSWTIEIRNALNAGLLPDGFYAYVDQRVDGPEPDVLAIDSSGKKKRQRSGGGIAVLDPPRTRLVQNMEPDSAFYARKANRLSVRHRFGDVIAIIEIVSPGNKDGSAAFEAFVKKAVAFLHAGVHLLIIDLFPPTPRDPQGVHRALLNVFGGQPVRLPANKLLTLASYQASPTLKGYIEPVAVGDIMIEMPLFLSSREHVPVPLEASYMKSWETCPEPTKALIEGRNPSPARGRRGR